MTAQNSVFEGSRPASIFVKPTAARKFRKLVSVSKKSGNLNFQLKHPNRYNGISLSKYAFKMTQNDLETQQRDNNLSALLK